MGRSRARGIGQASLVGRRRVARRRERDGARRNRETGDQVVLRWRAAIDERQRHARVRGVHRGGDGERAISRGHESRRARVRVRAILRRRGGFHSRRRRNRPRPRRRIETMDRDRDRRLRRQTREITRVHAERARARRSIGDRQIEISLVRTRRRARARTRSTRGRRVTSRRVRESQCVCKFRQR